MRYPIAPLLQAAGLTMSQLRGLCAMSGRTYRIALDEGITEGQADRYATKCGYHPAEIWPEMTDVAIMEISVECSAPDCGNLFVPSRKGHRYCRVRCYQKHYQRQWRQTREDTDPAFKAMRREGTTRWREQSRHTKRIKDRAYYAANADRIRAAARDRYQARTSRPPHGACGEVAA